METRSIPNPPTKLKTQWLVLIRATPVFFPLFGISHYWPTIWQCRYMSSSCSWLMFEELNVAVMCAWWVFVYDFKDWLALCFMWRPLKNLRCHEKICVCLVAQTVYTCPHCPNTNTPLILITEWRKNWLEWLDHIIKSLETPNVAYPGPTSLLILLSIAVWSNFSVFLMFFPTTMLTINMCRWKHWPIKKKLNCEPRLKPLG